MKLWAKTFGAVPTRVVLIVMMCSMSFVNYLMRVNISVSIIAMVPDAPSNISAMEPPLLNQTILNSDGVTDRRKTEDLDTFTWTAQEQSYVISAYAWGYAITALVGGTLAELWSPRKLVFSTMFVSGVLSLLSPQAAQLHYLVLVVARTMTGLCLGTQYSAVQVLVARWTPPDEKGISLGAGIIVGSALGTIFMWNISGVLINNLGWDYTFYIPGIVALTWSVLWWFTVYDWPALHPRISESEKNYILTAIGNKVQYKKKNSIEEWRPVFFIGAGIYLASALTFVIFGTGKTQSWNYVGTLKKEKDIHCESDIQKA